VATDFRLYVKAAFAEARRHALDLAGALAGRATDEAATPMPGYTHSRRAIPVTFGHWCLAYCEMLVRDASRLSDAAARADECPLGSGALAGTPVTVDREALARDLGFSGASRNSIDAVSDRDFAAEYLFCAALLLVHLSRLAEDVIMFSSDETGFLAIPDSLATGSSRMPHKKNPDLLELGRGHAGRAIGELAGFLSVIKGLPLAYDKDLQLDKEPVFRLRGVLGPILSALSRLIQDMRIDREAMRKAASDDRMLATDLADALAARGIPFREAHEIVGRRVMEGGRRGCGIAELGAGGGIERRDLEALDVDRTLSRRNSLGGTAPDRVIKAAEDMATLIGRMRRGL
jgi:argininosuccinate lyase